jgi:hypothetical protein
MVEGGWGGGFVGRVRCIIHICLTMVGVEERGFFESTVSRPFICHSDVMRALCQRVEALPASMSI